MIRCDKADSRHTVPFKIFIGIVLLKIGKPLCLFGPASVFAYVLAKAAPLNSAISIGTPA